MGMLHAPSGTCVLPWPLPDSPGLVVNQTYLLPSRTQTADA